MFHDLQLQYTSFLLPPAATYELAAGRSRNYGYDGKFLFYYKRILELGMTPMPT